MGTNPGGGGTETHMITLLRALAQLGVDAHALVHPRGKIAGALQGEAVSLHYGIFRNSADPHGLRALNRGLRQLRPDVLVGSFSKEYWPLAVLSRAHGVPLVLFRHMDLRLRPSTRWLLSHWPLRLFAVSAYLRERLIAQGLPEERVEVLRNPLSLADFQREPEARSARRQALGLREEDFLVGFVGAWHRGKGVFVLADAIDAAHAQDARVHGLWIGGGPHAEALRERLAGRSWQHVIGWQERVTPWYSVMDTLALASIEPDTFGRVLVEAQACAIPVLGAAMGGIPESFVDGVSGLLLPAGQSDVWRDAILRLASDRGLCRQLAAKGPEQVEGFAADAVAREFLAALGR